ncbi:MAG: hypothetical protein OEY49_13830 [Candidatus Heimdallarchaeota archaeon]|nr:hypothetical protein [Candidatus Heimdallarchaeota archaeon]
MESEDIFIWPDKIIHQRKELSTITPIPDNVEISDHILNYITNYSENNDMEIFSYNGPKDIEDGIFHVILVKKSGK